MRKAINLLVLVIVAGLGIGYFTVGPSFFLGGPKNSDIVAVARGILMATAATDIDKDRAKSAKVSPKGFCSQTKDASYACIVEVSVEGADPATVVTLLKKSADGVWVASE